MPKRRLGNLCGARNFQDGVSEMGLRGNGILAARLHPGLSWGHYRALLRVGGQEARDLYEIEASRNAWSMRELTRQTAGLLLDRLAKSQDKALLVAASRHSDWALAHLRSA